MDYIKLDWTLISELLLLFSCGIALAVLGYFLKGAWGAYIVLGIGVASFRYLKGLPPF